MEIGSIIMKKRKELGITQQVLAKKLHVSNQAVSKWENGMTCPEISLLPAIAKVFGMSVDSLLGYQSPIWSDYEKRYQEKGYYWGIKPNDLCYEILKLKPPIKPLKVLDVGCGEGKDAVFLARNGYHVSAFDLAETGVEKGRALASQHGVYVDFFTANIEDMQLCEDYDIVLCSGVFHFLKPEKRKDVVNELKQHTKPDGIHVMNVFVDKPFVEILPGKEKNRFRWKSGQIFTLYHDWYFHKIEEVVFDCNSGGVPHQHCMDIMIARNKSKES